MKRIVSLQLAVLFLIAAPAGAEWSHDVFAPDPVETTDSSSPECEGLPYGDGGTLVVYRSETYAGSSLYGVVAQLLDADGVPQWGHGLVLDAANDGSSGYLDACSDGLGGAYIVYSTNTANGWKARARRLLADGSDPWGSYLYVGYDIEGNQTNLDAALSDDGSLLVAWTDTRDLASSGYDIYAQKASPAGKRDWDSGGAPICTAVGTQTNAVIAGDGLGGAIIVWTDSRNYSTAGYDIFGNHITAAGVLAFNASTCAMVSTGPEHQTNPRICSALPGRVILTWTDYSVTPEPHIEATCLSTAWFSSWHCSLTEHDGACQGARLVPDGTGGAFIAWEDLRDNGEVGYDIYAQWIDLGGHQRWEAEGTPVGIAPGGQVNLALAAHPDGGVVVGWQDSRYGGLTGVFGQHLDADGNRRWGETGLEVASTAGSPGDIQLSVDARAGTVITFRHSGGSSQYDVFAMRVDRWGALGDPSPVLTGVGDYPQDQGGVAIVDWTGSYLDDYAYLDIDHYSLWRRYLGLTEAPKAAQPAADLVARAAGLPTAEAAALLDAGWAFETTVPALLQGTYSAHVATYGDSTAAGLPLTEFQVLAHGAETFPFWTSNPGSGYSLDNLSPSEPLELVAWLEAADAVLEWDPATTHAEDVLLYRVYRGDSPGFAVGPSSYLGEAAARTYTDPGLPAGTWYFRVSAVDVHGNEGPASNETALANLSGTAEAAPTVFRLCGAWPNPFNPSTRIAFDLARSAPTRLVLHDLRGNLVRVLVDEVRGPGRQVVEWDGRSDDGRAAPSGVYLSRLVSGGESATAKLMLVR